MILIALFAAATAGAVPHPGPKIDAPIVGRYEVRRGVLAVCTLDLSFEPTVGGEVEPSRTCLRPLGDAARWYGDGKGGFVLHDPLRKPVGRAVEDEFGYTLFLPDNRRFDLKKLNGPRMRTDAERAAGSWSVRTEDPAKVVCRIELKPGGAIGPARACPATLRPYGGGRWRAGADGVTLTVKGAPGRALRWGDAVSLIGDSGRLLLLHD